MKWLFTSLVFPALLSLLETIVQSEEYGLDNFSLPISYIKSMADVLKVLEDGDLQTLGLLDYDKRLTHSFTAHPKVDPLTGKRLLFV